MNQALLVAGLYVNTLAQAMIEVPIYRKQIEEEPWTSKPRVMASSEKIDLIAIEDSTKLESSTPKKKDYREFKLGNYRNVQYHGELLIGSQKESHEFIFDTGSPWMWVAGEDCKFCHTTKLFQKSESMSFKRLSNEVKPLMYAQGSSKGYISSDQVCLGSDACVQDMLFVDVHSTSEIKSHYNGVLGLAPGGSSIAATRWSARSTNSYVDRLKQAGLIDKRLFSFYLNDEDDSDSSMITFGGYDVAKYAPNQNVTWN